MNFNKLSSVFFLLILVVIFSSCKKSTVNPFTTELENMAKENALIEAAFDDVLKLSENSMMNNGDARTSTIGAPLGCITDIDTVVTGTNKIVYTINFNSSCTSYDGKIRSGKIIVELNGANFNTTGSILTITFDNYSFDSNVLQGKMIVTKEDSSKFKIQVSDVQGTGYASLYMNTTQKTVQWRAVCKRELTPWNNDLILLNNSYLITTPLSEGCYMDGITSDNKTYTANIAIPLKLDYSCRAVGTLRYPVAGSIDYSMSAYYDRTVDYGDGTICDNAVKMTFSDESTDYILY